MRIAIVGGGAAGLMAAAAIVETNLEAEVFLLEKNDALGRKVLISGGGRCNVTTGLEDVNEILKRYPRGGKFLNSAMRAFPPTATRAWFEGHGVPLKVEEDNRVFPVSNDGHDVVGAFERVFRDSGRVRLSLNSSVKSVAKRDDGFVLTLADGRAVEADRLIITTGGQAYRATGSSGDGYAFAEFLGHHLTPLAPSLNSLGTAEDWPKALSGLSFQNVRLTAHGAKTHRAAGPLLLTHRGISGPAVFALSSEAAFETYGVTNPLRVEIDLFPDDVHDSLLARLMSLVQENPKKELQNVLAMMIPKSLAETVSKLLELGDKPVVEISRKDLVRVIERLKRVPLNVTSRGAGEEFVTAGGVDLKEVDPRTMQSKIVPGLYFAGEILDIDGVTGGFNLQAAWATGHLAGSSATK
jgi:hypothetical protein